MSNITLADAATITEGARAAGREHAFQPLCVVVLDAGGHVVMAQRENGSGIIRFELALGKAYGALGFGIGSRTLAARAVKVPGFMNAAIMAADGRVVPAPGGVLIRDSNGATIGAVGISGDTGENDEICALAGVAAAGLVADPGA